MLKIGDTAPSFTLFSSEKNEVSLSDFQGQSVVILFFPLAFTGVCTTELCNTRDDIQSYKNLNAQVIAISVDSLFTLEKFKAEDFVLGMKKVAKRSAFVVDKNGIIQYAEVLESAGDLPNFDAVKSTLQNL
jgi:peroxiredoxin